MEKIHLVVFLGFIMGLRHAMDSDHIVAMSTLVSRTKKRGVSWILGAFWGLGHTLTILGVGAVIIVAKISVPESLASALEFSVGAMLALLGILNLWGLRFGNWGMEEHSHAHAHDEDHHHHVFPETHAHSHSHFHLTEFEKLLQSAGKLQIIRSFCVGLIHGLAGSTAAALLVLTAIPGTYMALTYLLVFGIGSVISMAAVSALMEFMMYKTMNWIRLDRWLVPATGVMSLGFGLYIMYQFS